MNEYFNNLPWHDAELKQILIDYINNENVEIVIRWPQMKNHEFSTIKFMNCYAFKSNINLGFSSPNTILEAVYVQDSPEINELKDRWSKMGVDLSMLGCYRILTNTSNSVIDIFALSYEIADKMD